jgi:PAS domain S-box-containing protein
MKLSATRVLVVTSKDQSYWAPLDAIAAKDASFDVVYATTERETQRGISRTGITIALTDLTASVSVGRLNELLPAGSIILAFIPSSLIDAALTSLDDGLYDYILVEHPERLRVALAHIQHSHEIEQRATIAIEQVQHAEEQQRFLIENILDVITVTDINATILYESGSLERVLGYRPEELVGKNAFSYIHPLDIPRTMPVFMLAVATPGVPHSTRFRFKHKSGTWRMLEAVGKTTRDPELGYRLIVTSRDITDRERAEEALGQSELRFRSVIESLSEGIAITSRDGDVSYFNSRMTELTGFEPQEVLGKKLFPLIIPQEMWSERDTWIKSKAARKPQKMETEILRRDGSRVWVEIRTTPYQDGDQQLGTISAFVDISERRVFQAQLEAEREQAIIARDHAETMNRLKSNFLANLSHEIRTPLTGILGFANLLNEQLVDEEQKIYSTLITSAGSRLLETMNALIDLSTIESGRLELNPAPTDLTPETDRVVKLLRPISEGKLLNLEFTPPATPVIAYVDPHYFSETLRHVIGNAIKFTESGRIDVRVELDADARKAIVTVQDTGVGISEEFLPAICEPFQQESAGIDRRFEGNGLGLTLTKHFLQEMGGALWVTSAIGVGSTFRMTYPLPPDPDSPPKRGFLSRLGIGS